MTLDEAIKHCEEVVAAAENTLCLKGGLVTRCAEEHRQLVEWLKDYKRLLEQEPCDDAVSRGVFKQVMWERDIAIEQLHELGYELGQKIEPCDDAISRAEAQTEIMMSKSITAFDRDLWIKTKDAVQIIRELPSVTQKSGEWILLDECANSGYYCSNCQKKLVKEGWSNTVKKIKFCPNCGSAMKGE